jgi:hypothetical protein
LSETELKALEEYLPENLAKSFIRPSSSPSAAPILFDKEKDGSLRLCVKYRRLNTITMKDRYPPSLIQESLDGLNRAKVYSKVDPRGVYNLNDSKKGEGWKIAFKTRYGLFEYAVVPLGLTNAPATFQCILNEVMQEQLDVCVIVFLSGIHVALVEDSSLHDHPLH